ncbi:MAG: ECF transporter S component, partial [Actinomycetota bacterium]|nr:ECF transporter S component [Actinomycetota bacterium]
MNARSRWRTILLVLTNVGGAAAFLWPFLVPSLVRHRSVHASDAPLILAGLLVCVGALLFVELGRGGMGPKVVALTGVLGAAMVALRLPGFIAGFSAMFIVVLLAGNAFGPSFGFLLGAVGTFASGLFVGGLGPWLPFQMIAVGWVGAGAGLMPRRGKWSARIVVLSIYGFFAAFAFGIVINLWSWPYLAGSSRLGWSSSASLAENVKHYATFYALTSA